MPRLLSPQLGATLTLSQALGFSFEAFSSTKKVVIPGFLVVRVLPEPSLGGLRLTRLSRAPGWVRVLARH